MGIWCVISLPGNVRVYDVAEVIAASLGTQLHMFGPSANAPGWEVEAIPTEPRLCRITCRDRTEGRCADMREFTFHFEGPGGRRLLMPASTPHNIALGRRLIDFFGGTMRYRDDSGVSVNYGTEDGSNAQNGPEEGVDWADLQRRMVAILPIAADEIERVRQFAAYPEGE